jgi:hypothetical protein
MQALPLPIRIASPSAQPAQYKPSFAANYLASAIASQGLLHPPAVQISSEARKQ